MRWGMRLSTLAPLALLPSLVSCITTETSHGNSGGSSLTRSAGGAAGDGAAAGAGAGAPGAGNGGTGSAGPGTAGVGNGGAGIAGMGSGGTGAGTGNGGGGASVAGNGGAAAATVVGNAGIAAWDALPAAAKGEVQAFRSFFLHQSVGTDLEDGAEAGGFKFEYVASGASSLAAGLNGGLFDASNGNYTAKTKEFRDTALANKGTVRVAIMKLGYADVLDDTLPGVQSSYLDAVKAIKAANIRVLHLTPPLVYDAPQDNAPKMKMRSWMLATFSDDVIFDLQDLESTDPTTGARCERGGAWEICNSVRSTSSCPSKSQGVDAPSGQGHLCFDPHAARLAKAFLYAIRRAGS